MGFYIVFKCFKYSLMRLNFNSCSRKWEGLRFSQKTQDQFYSDTKKRMMNSPHSNQLENEHTYDKLENSLMTTHQNP